MDAVELRAYTPDDVERVVELALEAWAPVFASFEQVLGGDLYRRVYPDWKKYQAGSVRDALAKNVSWVAVVEEAVVGFVNVVFDDAERSGDIYMIAVAPMAQGRGVAGQLTELALHEMRARGMTMATVATGGDPGHAPARRTYERAGFTPFPQVWYARLLD